MLEPCFFGCADENHCQGLCDYSYAYGVVRTTLNRAEQAALADFLPRVQVANVCIAGSALHSALKKVSPKSLPWDLRNA